MTTQKEGKIRKRWWLLENLAVASWLRAIRRESCWGRVQRHRERPGHHKAAGVEKCPAKRTPCRLRAMEHRATVKLELSTEQMSCCGEPSALTQRKPRKMWVWLHQAEEGGSMVPVAENPAPVRTRGAGRDAMGGKVTSIWSSGWAQGKHRLNWLTGEPHLFPQLLSLRRQGVRLSESRMHCPDFPIGITVWPYRLFNGRPKAILNAISVIIWTLPGSCKIKAHKNYVSHFIYSHYDD